MGAPRLPPRIGAFEVVLALLNCRTGAVYGPDVLFSKLHSNCWPLLPKLSERLHEQVQHWLLMDNVECDEE